MSRLEFARQRLIGMINRIETAEEIQELVDLLYLREEEKKREQKEREKEKSTKPKKQ
ncbi:MAG: hypothetical protein ACK40M_12340 [Flavobacteriales bacterium]